MVVPLLLAGRKAGTINEVIRFSGNTDLTTGAQGCCQRFPIPATGILIDCEVIRTPESPP